MEAVEAFLDGEWESLSKLFSCEDSDLLLHCNTNNLFSYSENYNVGAIDASNLLLPSKNLLDHTSFYSAVSHESSHSSSNENTNNNNIESSSLFAPVAAHDVSFTTNSFDQSMFPDDLMEEILQLKAQILCNDDQFQDAGLIRPRESDDSCKEEMQLKRKYEAPNNALQPSQDHNISSQSSKKRRRVAREVQAQASKSNAETKKAKRAAKTSTNDDEEMNINGGSTCSSEGDDCNASEESESKGSTSAKAKASKSPATDPQSLYARKRRERINERLRVLQNLVPNGTKVDISTMLEEAVQYVKFLQLQIKLLSCDDMWMYAPIAYNGMDIGLYQRIAPNM